MKIATALFIPAISALLLARAVVPVDEPLEITDPTEFSYTMPWSYGSLDEALWLALDDIATIRKYMPPEVDHFRVVIPPYGDNTSFIFITFDRSDLELLATGELAPEMFIRNHVTFE